MADYPYINLGKVVANVNGYNVSTLTVSAPMSISANGNTFNITLPAASSSTAGYMSVSDKLKLDGLPVFENLAAVSEGTELSLVTTGDKYRWNAAETKLNGIEVGANNYVHPEYLSYNQYQSLYKIAINKNGHITGCQTVKRSDLTNIIQSLDKYDYEEYEAAQNYRGLMSAADKLKLDDIEFDKTYSGSEFTVPRRDHDERFEEFIVQTKPNIGKWKSYTRNIYNKTESIHLTQLNFDDPEDPFNNEYEWLGAYINGGNSGYACILRNMYGIDENTTIFPTAYGSVINFSDYDLKLTDGENVIQYTLSCDISGLDPNVNYFEPGIGMLTYGEGRSAYTSNKSRSLIFYNLFGEEWADITYDKQNMKLSITFPIYDNIDVDMKIIGIIITSGRENVVLSNIQLEVGNSATSYVTAQKYRESNINTNNPYIAIKSVNLIDMRFNRMRMGEGPSTGFYVRCYNETISTEVLWDMTYFANLKTIAPEIIRNIWYDDTMIKNKYVSLYDPSYQGYDYPAAYYVFNGHVCGKDINMMLGYNISENLQTISDEYISISNPPGFIQIIPNGGTLPRNPGDYTFNFYTTGEEGNLNTMPKEIEIYLAPIPALNKGFIDFPFQDSKYTDYVSNCYVYELPENDNSKGSYDLIHGTYKEEWRLIDSFDSSLSEYLNLIQNCEKWESETQEYDSNSTPNDGEWVWIKHNTPVTRTITGFTSKKIAPLFESNTVIKCGDCTVTEAKLTTTNPVLTEQDIGSKVGVPYENATTSSNGLMSSSDKAKLDMMSISSNGISTPETISNQHVASFTSAAAGRPLHATVNIEPVQASGTPSPENPLPITGWTGVNVMRMGKNLIFKEIPNAFVYTNGAFSSHESAKVAVAKVLAGYTYAFNVNIPGQNFVSVGFFYNIPALWDRTYDQSRIDATSGTFTAPITGYAVINIPSSMTDPIQIEHGGSSTSYTTPETPVAISFPSSIGTVYGGTLDVARGLLTVTWKVKLFSSVYSRMSIPAWGNDIAIYRLTSTIEASWYKRPSKCDKLIDIRSASGNRPAYGYGNYDATSGVAITLPSSYDTLEKAQAWISENPVTIAYETSSPVTYQLTPQQLVTLAGTNNVFADCGTVDVTYWPGTGVPMTPVNDKNNITLVKNILTRMDNLETAIVQMGGNI